MPLWSRRNLDTHSLFRRLASRPSILSVVFSNSPSPMAPILCRPCIASTISERSRARILEAIGPGQPLCRPPCRGDMRNVDQRMLKLVTIKHLATRAPHQ